MGRNFGTVPVFDGTGCKQRSRDQWQALFSFLAIIITDELPVSLAKYQHPSPSSTGLALPPSQKYSGRKPTLSLSDRVVDKSGPIGEKDSRLEKSVERMDQAKQAARQDALKDKDVISKRVRLWGVPWQLLGFSSVFYWGRRFPLPMPHNDLQKSLLWCFSTSNIRKSKGTKLLAQYPETLSGETTACFFAAQRFTPPHPPLGVR